VGLAVEECTSSRSGTALLVSSSVSVESSPVDDAACATGAAYDATGIAMSDKLSTAKMAERIDFGTYRIDMSYRNFCLKEILRERVIEKSM